MDKPNERRGVIDEASAYLETHDVYFLFRHLLKSLITEQPEDPLQHLIDVLQRPAPMVLSLVSAPGLHRRKHALEIADKFQLAHIDVGEILRKAHPAAVANAQFVPDSDVISLVQEAIANVPGENGYLLDGFPRTRVQGRALQRMKIVPEKVIFLTGDAKQVKTRLLEQAEAASLASGGGGGTLEERVEVVSAKLQQHLRHLHETAEIFRNNALELSANEEESVVTDLETVLHRAASGDPRGPLRVCVVGALASGRSTQARLLAQDFGVVHVDVNALVAEKGTLGQGAEDVSDEDVCDLVGRRLRQLDCLRKGWVLDGFPLTVAQAQFLKKAHLWPTRILHLSVPESVCLQRRSIRRVDPVTGYYYYGNPPQLSIRQRVVQEPCDTPENVSKRYHKFYATQQEIMSQFLPQCQATMRSNQEPVVLQFAIQDFIKSKKK